jgi:hypothetical protein
MTNSMTTTTPNNIAAAAIAAYVNEAEPQNLIGKLMKFSKGEFLIGIDGEEVPEGSVFTVACDLALAGWIRWEGGRPAESKLIRIASGAPAFKRDELGHDDRSQ